MPHTYMHKYALGWYRVVHVFLKYFNAAVTIVGTNQSGCK